MLYIAKMKDINHLVKLENFNIKKDFSKQIIELKENVITYELEN